MNLALAIFALSAACIAYANVIYPLLVMILARRKGPAPARGDAPQSVSIILAAHNEPALAARVSELCGMIASSGIAGEMIVVLDGYTDRGIPRPQGLRVIELPRRLGKAAAINAGCAAAAHEILVLADARQTWDPDALKHLLAAFENPQVGAVSGELLLAPAPGVAGGVGLYWKYEKFIRRHESRLHSTIGVTGAICAVRARLFHPMPQGLILDDVYWPLRVAMAGYRVIFEPRAQAHDRLPERARDEFRRKVRTLSGNFQLIQYLPSALLPWRNPLWWQLISHKLLRLAVPWAMAALLISNTMLSSLPMFRATLIAQLAGYMLSLFGLSRLGAKFRPAAAGGAFLLLNAAVWVAFWVWIFGKAGRSWNRTPYSAIAPAAG